MKSLFIITTFLFSNILFSQKLKEYQAWQFFIGKTAFEITNTWDIGLNRYYLNDRKVFRFGMDLGYHQSKSERTIDMNKRYNLYAYQTIFPIPHIDQYNADYFLRAKPFASVGYKIIKRKKYSTDISVDMGLGLNLWRKTDHHYYALDSLWYPTGELIEESGRKEEYSFLRRPDLFIGLSNSHYFQLKKIGPIYFDFLFGLDFCLYNNPLKDYYNHLYLQAKLGFTLPD